MISPSRSLYVLQVSNPRTPENLPLRLSFVDLMVAFRTELKLKDAGYNVTREVEGAEIFMSPDTALETAQLFLK